MKSSARFRERFRHHLLLAPLSLFAIVAMACSSEGPGGSTGSTCPSDSTLTYATFGQPFVAKYCLSCHRTGGPETPTLSTIDQIRSKLDLIDRSAAAGPKAVNTFMPDGSPVPEAERRQLGEWLACGAPE